MPRLPNILALAVLLALPGIGAGAEPNPAAQAANSQPMQMLAPDTKAQNWFGVAVENIPPAVAKLLKLKANQGLMVSAVLPGSPAEKAGLKPDDLLVELNGQPLTAQHELFEAANPSAEGKAVPAIKPSRITLLREGDRSTVDITPAKRPETMTVFRSPNENNTSKITNYVIPNGGGAQVGPGYIINLGTSDPADFTVKSIKSLVSKGQTIVLTQETDIAGTVKHTITVGATVYRVDPENVNALPADVQPIARQLIGVAATGPAPKTVPAGSKSLEDRLKLLEARNAQLRQELEELKKSRELESKNPEK